MLDALRVRMATSRGDLHVPAVESLGMLSVRRVQSDMNGVLRERGVEARDFTLP